MSKDSERAEGRIEISHDADAADYRYTVIIEGEDCRTVRFRRLAEVADVLHAWLGVEPPRHDPTPLPMDYEGYEDMFMPWGKRGCRSIFTVENDGDALDFEYEDEQALVISARATTAAEVADFFEGWRRIAYRKLTIEQALDRRWPATNVKSYTHRDGRSVRSHKRIERPSPE